MRASTYARTQMKKTMRSILRVLQQCAAFLFLGCVMANTHAVETSAQEKTCTEIGFKPKTEAHAECVIELFERTSRATKSKRVERTASSSLSSQSREATVPQKGDGTAEHTACAQFGFVVGTAAYSDCRLKMAIAKREAQHKQAAYELAQRQYEAELRQYEEQVARYEKEKERQKSDAFIRFGAALLGGSSPHFSENFANAGRASLGLPPSAPTAPSIQNFNITGPSGRMTSCSVVGNNINCF
jgi:hypothetical protein